MLGKTLWKIIVLSCLTITLEACVGVYYPIKSSQSRIKLVIVGNKALNVYKSKSHPLVIALYQLENLDQIRTLPDNLDFNELQKQFEKNIERLSFNTIVLLPGSAKRIELVAQKAAKFLVVIAGYYVSEKRKEIMAIYKIETYKKGLFGFEYGNTIVPEIYVRFSERKIA